MVYFYIFLWQYMTSLDDELLQIDIHLELCFVMVR